MYSGIMTKIGDTTERVIAADCLILHVPPDHDELYREFLKLRQTLKWGSHHISRQSILADYIAPAPPERGSPEWKRVRVVRDFDLLARMAIPQEDGTTYVREPLRTISREALKELGSLSVFRQSTSRPTTGGTSGDDGKKKP
jgi:hypothetical protein